MDDNLQSERGEEGGHLADEPIAVMREKIERVFGLLEQRQIFQRVEELDHVLHVVFNGLAGRGAVLLAQ